MTTFYERDFAGRWGAMGDESEQRFEEVTATGVAPFGLNRPPINVAKLPAFIRYMPDRLVHDRLVECMGIGRDAILKLKLDKLAILQRWDDVFPVDLFIWDSAAKRYTQQPIRDVEGQCLLHGEFGRFPEGKPAWFLDTRRCKAWDWTPYAAT